MSEYLTPEGHDDNIKYYYDESCKGLRELSQKKEEIEKYSPFLYNIFQLLFEVMDDTNSALINILSRFRKQETRINNIDEMFENLNMKALVEMKFEQIKEEAGEDCATKLTICLMKEMIEEIKRQRETMVSLFREC